MYLAPSVMRACLNSSLFKIGIGFRVADSRLKCAWMDARTHSLQPESLKTVGKNGLRCVIVIRGV